MAKASRRRRRFNLRRVRVNSSITIGALATKALVAAAASGVTTGTLRVVSTKCTFTWSGIGAQIDDSLEFGWAHSDYTAAEIEECLEASGSMDPGEKVQGEQANRLVRTVGVISAASIAAGGGTAFNDGKPITTKLNWLLSPADSLKLWARNGSGVVYTTGSTLSMVGDLWVKDSV